MPTVDGSQTTTRLWIDVARVPTAERLFGLAPVERLRRSVFKFPAPFGVVLSGAGSTAMDWPHAAKDDVGTPLGTRLRNAIPQQGGTLVALDGANVVDPRLIEHLLAGGIPSVAMRGDGAQRAVVLRLDASVTSAIPADAATLRDVADALLAQGVPPLDEAAFPAYVDKLRRTLPYWIYGVDSADTRKQLERKMFWDNYKGSTDFLTRYVYPPIVWPLVKICTRLRIHPNAVTLFAILLAIAAVPLWANGEWLWGFICAYGMSVLDSVDGKIARVTLTDSRIGNVLDHGTDQVHPPFWYFAWAWGLSFQYPESPLLQAAGWLVFFYFADRIVLAIAKRRLGFALHAATELDGRIRTFIARRNITMTIMAFALLVGMGPLGFYIITAWQGATFAWHAFRTWRVPQFVARRPRQRNR